MLPADLAGERAKVLLLADNATGGLWHARYSGGGTHEVLSHCGPGDTSVIAERLYEGDAVLLSNAKHTARNYADALAELERVRSALEWYGEQARLCRLIHSEGDAGRHALSADGGKRALAALAPAPEEPNGP